MRVDAFDFHLPTDLIALRPIEPRDAARLLVVNGYTPLQDANVLDLPKLLAPGDALVFNDTKVIPAQLHGHRLPRQSDQPSAHISATLHQRLDSVRWAAFMKPAKKIRMGDHLVFSKDSATLHATVERLGEAGEVFLVFDATGPELDLALMEVGHIPLPPYIASRRADDVQDLTDYQTIYAREQGAVAAPTAGLHFTDRLFKALEQRGVERHFVTLHVGAGTFLPVKAEDTADHKMHSETGFITQQTADHLNRIRQAGGRIVCVGTTSLRLLESAAAPDGQLNAFHGSTDIFITPGYRFKIADALMTNFHLPKSTLMMLVSAFAGFDQMRAAYAHAITQEYRFYSYGDGSLLFREPSL